MGITAALIILLRACNRRKLKLRSLIATATSTVGLRFLSRVTRQSRKLSQRMVRKLRKRLRDRSWPPITYEMASGDPINGPQTWTDYELKDYVPQSPAPHPDSDEPPKRRSLLRSLSLRNPVKQQTDSGRKSLLRSISLRQPVERQTHSGHKSLLRFLSLRGPVKQRTGAGGLVCDKGAPSHRAGCADSMTAARIRGDLFSGEGYIPAVIGR